MANLIIHAIEIKLGQEYNEDISLGLYTASGLSYLRWSEAPLVDVAEAWSHDLLLKNGISEIVERSDLSRGGNIAEYSGMTVRATNAEDLKVYLDDLGVNLIGLSATLTEFEGTAQDSDYVARNVRFTGIVEDIKWGDTTLTMSLKNSLYKRETNIGTVTSEGVEVPVTFGKHTPPLTKIVDGVEVATKEVKNLAKFVRTDDSQTILADSFFTGSSYTETTVFPVIELISTTKYRCKLRGYGFGEFTIPDNLYVIVKDGTSEAKGQIRQVTNYQLDGTQLDGMILDFTIADVFFKELSITGDDRSWVQFVQIDRVYQSDTWPCKDFLKSEDGIATDKHELNTFVDSTNSYNRIADFGFKATDTNNNKLDIDGQQCTDDIDNIDSFIILPVNSVAVSSVVTGTVSSGMTHIANGFFKGTSDRAIASSSSGDFDKCYDRDIATFGYQNGISVTGSTGSPLINSIFTFDLPNFSNLKKTEIEGVYIGLKIRHTSTGGRVSLNGINIDLIRYAYPKSTDTKLIGTTASETFDIDNIIDQYYITSPNTSNLNFYKSVTTGSLFSGYELFKFDGIDKNNIDIFNSGVLTLMQIHQSGFTVDVSNNIYELAIIFKLASSDIKKELYSPLSGRIFGDTFESRKNYYGLMENPKDIIEHCKRLQDWSESSALLFNWGKEYALSEDSGYYDKIKLTGEGSFDSANLNYLATEKVCLQITDNDKQTTTAITKKMCDTGHVCSYIDSDGYECLETLEATNPSETINLSDVIGSIGDVIEPQIENIYCEPVINYLFNQGSQKFDRTMSVTNIGESSWQSSYTPGYLDADGQIIWNTCKALYQKYRQIERCPDDFSNHPELADYQTVVNYVKRKLSWMDKKRLPTITIAYSKGKDYTIFKHLLVQLPTHTRNSVIECIIEKIVKDKNSGIVKIDCVILGNMESAWYDTSDSTNEKVDTADNGNEAVIDV